MVRIREGIEWLQEYTPSGISRLLRRWDLKLRSAVVQQWSPDPAYLAKRDHLLACLRDVARAPERKALVFLDEMGLHRWPDPGPDWGDRAPIARRAFTKEQTANNSQWRIVGALNALTGQVTYLDAYIVGREKVIEIYRQLDRVYDPIEELYVVADNWSIHTHPDVLEAVATLPRITPVSLPTYSPWLNPIEKLWRWLRQDLLKLHRSAEDWAGLRGQVRAFLNQFTAGSEPLLRYVGLLGEGKLAQALQGL